MNYLEIYNEIIEMRTKLKACQQLSWDIGTVDKRYPIQSIPDEELPALHDIYSSLHKRLLDLSKEG